MSRRLPAPVSTVLYWLLAAEFAVGAITKYWPGPTWFGPAYSEKFVAWGYPSWMRFVVGTLELVSAVLLVIPDRRRRFLGASILLLVLTGAVTTHIVNHDPWWQSIAAPTLWVVCGCVVLVNWLPDWRLAVRRAIASQ